MITRRQFLKRVGTVCTAAIVAPAVLVKAKPQKPVRGNRAKQVFIGNQRILILDEFAKMDLYDKELIRKMETAFWNTKFKSPLMSWPNSTQN